MTIGLNDLVYAKITGTGSEAQYGAPKKLAEAISADISVTVAEGILYADDTVSESIKEFVKGVIKLGIKELSVEHVADILGQKVDSDKVIYGGADDKAPFVAIGFRAKKTEGVYRYIWLYKVKFKIPNEKFQTKGEAIQFNTQELEGEFFKREKDGNWKADFTGLESNEVAKAFLSTVREPKE